MKRSKGILGLLLVLVMVIAPVTAVGAASPVQTTDIEGTIDSCETATDALTGDTIVVCVVNLSDEETLTIRLSVEDAVALGLAIVEEDGTVKIIATEGQPVLVDPELVLADPCVMPEDADHPVSKAFANYFCESLGVDYNTLQSLHEDGFGFGEIAQACFMAIKLDGTGNLCLEILHAKQSGDYSGLTLPDGVTVSNWGQLKKAVLHGEPKKDANPGSIMSDKSKDNGQGQEHGKSETAKEHGKGKK